MHILKSCVLAFSIYSRIPVPQFEWKEEDMRYMLCFFPWIGGAVGGCVYLWCSLCGLLGIGEICRVLVGAAIPLVLTGGFHADGFLDTMDAFHSYQPKERKLEILKDSHIGAFAVIMLGVYGMIYMGAFSEVTDRGLLKAVCGGFFLSRCLSGGSVVSFAPAKKEGMLSFFAGSSRKATVRRWLYLQGILCIGFMLRQSVYAGAVIAAAMLAFAYYAYRSKKELGGITGDTAGYFVLICEAGMMGAAAAVNLLACGGRV